MHVCSLHALYTLRTLYTLRARRTLHALRALHTLHTFHTRPVRVAAKHLPVRLLGRPHPHRRRVRLRVREGGRRTAHPGGLVFRPVRLVRLVAARGVLRVRAVCGGIQRGRGGRAAVYVRRVLLHRAADKSAGVSL